ncbi:MAG: hypothetical protein ACXVJT_01970 [Thermoanaerobaculia bacterium]
MRLALAALIAIVAACSPAPPAKTAPQARSAADLVDREGDSTDTAAVVPADAPEEGVKFENDWIYDRVGRFRRLSHGTGVLHDRRYDVIEVETPSGEKHKFYFDITENWKKWNPM